VLYTVPKTGEKHELAVGAFRVVRDFLATLVEPFIETFRRNYATFAMLHRRPHAVAFSE
jgi:uncharacterized protein YggT (Ycf19 family)